MQRNDWKNLNGLWDYAIIDKGGHIPADFEGKILVPFAVESSLSGVGKRINEKQELVYQRSLMFHRLGKESRFCCISVL